MAIRTITHVRYLSISYEIDTDFVIESLISIMIDRPIIWIQFPSSNVHKCNCPLTVKHLLIECADINDAFLSLQSRSHFRLFESSCAVQAL